MRAAARRSFYTKSHERVHFYMYSDSAFLQKRATLTACLRKVEKMASDKEMLYTSALEKLAEFRGLRYPHSVLSTQRVMKECTHLAASSGEGTWISVRYALR